VGVVPDHLRSAIAAELSALVRGERPDLLVWVHRYGERGATLVVQPDAIWTHRFTDALRTDTGEWHVVVPLWTTDEEPSDLSAEIRVTTDERAEVVDVHVL
jgi:hypothetical protein